ncbi:MAG: Uma2 family endonuclease [Lachnospiraceae bacterium]|nr:Uma2 family endonuclease [Lachnospiraceae bacterium]
MELPQPKLYTTEDIYALPEGTRAELIDGQLYYMAPPNRRHQELAGELFGSIREYIRSNNGSCRPYIAPFAVFLNADNRNYVEPDISVICDRDKLTDNGCNGAPDWIIEIVSPGSRRTDYFTKLFKYRTAGVREYWIVDPEKNRITVYNFETEDTLEYSFKDSVQAGIYPGFCINFAGLDI